MESANPDNISNRQTMCIVAILLSLLLFSFVTKSHSEALVDLRENRYYAALNLSASLDDVIDNWRDTSQIQCASRCNTNPNCDSFTWSASDALCSIGKFNGTTATTTKPSNDSRQLYVSDKVCRGDLGFELRSNSNGTVARCLYLSWEEVTNEEAEVNCSHLGGRLFKANSLELIDLVAQMIIEREYVIYYSVRVGMDDRALEDSFVWVDGQPMTNEERSKLFYGGQPDDYDGLEDCGEIFVPFGYKLNDCECNSKTLYVCEVAP